MASLEWEQLMEAEEHGDGVALPPRDRYDVDNQGTFNEVSFNMNDKKEIIRIERLGRVIRKEKKVSKAAIAREKTLKKFGAVANILKGRVEKGVTTIRLEEWPFIWEGEVKEVVKPKPRIEDKLPINQKSTETLERKEEETKKINSIRASRIFKFVI